MTRSAGPKLLLAAGVFTLLVLISFGRIRTIDRLSDQGYFDKYPYFAKQLRDGQLSADRLSDVSPAYLQLVALLQESWKLDPYAIRDVQVTAVTVAALLCALAAALLSGRIAATATALFVLGNRAALVNATEIEPETLILVVNSIAVLLLVLWRRGEHPAFLAAAGLAFGISAITRPTALIAIVLLTMWMAVTAQRRVRAGLLFLALALLPVLILGAVRLARGRSAVIMDPGTVFYEGMNPLASGYGGVQPRIVNDLERLTSARDALHFTYQLVAREAMGYRVTKAESNRYWTGKAIGYLRTYPSTAAGLVLRKTFFAMHSYEAYDLTTMVRKEWELRRRTWIPFGVLIALGLVGAALRGKDAAELAIVSAASALPLILFYVTARQRNAMLPVVAVLAGVAITSAFTSWKEGRRRPVILSLALVGVASLILTYDGSRQREDQHAWISALSAQELRARARALRDPAKAELVRGHAGTWLTSDPESPPCSAVVPAAVRELKRATTEARIFDLAVILTRCQQWELADTILLKLQRDGYRPVRDTRAPSSVAYHRALAQFGRGHEIGELVERAAREAPGDADILALQVARGQTGSLTTLDRLHDPFTRDLALAQAHHYLGETQERDVLLQALRRRMPQWQRPAKLTQ